MSLTTFSYYVRKSLPFLIAACIIIVTLYSAIGFLLKRSKENTPVVLNPRFGKIERPIIANKLTYPENPTFTLDNIEGKPIIATAAGQVFFVPRPKTKFGYLETIYAMAKNSSFDTTESRHSLENNIASFSNINQTLTIDITNYNFELERNYIDNTSYFDAPNIPDENQIQQDAKEFLDTMGRYPDELRQGTINIIYLSHNTGSKDFSVVRNAREADVVEVDFFRPDVDGYPIVSPRYFNSQNFVVLTYPKGVPTVIKSQVHHFENDKATVGAYPLITGETAWKLFQEGGGQIISNQNPTNAIRITDMYLGYLDIEQYHQHIQPIYVFLGENNFVGWVEAITPEYFK